MKAGYQIWLIIFCVLTHGAGFASASVPAAQQSTANSTTAANRRSSDDEHPDPSSKHRYGPNAPARTQHVTGKIPLPARANVVQANRSKMVRNNNSQGLKLRGLMDYPQPASMNRISAGKASGHNLPTRQTTVAGIAGYEFKNRHRAPVPATIGGPANKTRNTAAINGTGMARKHMN